MAKQSNIQKSIPTDGNTAVICFPSQGEKKENVHWILSEGKERGWFPVTISSRTGDAIIQGSDRISSTGYKSKVRDCNALRDEQLLERLENRGINRLVLCGGHTNHEVESTARAAVKRGFKTIVVADTTSPGETRSIDGTCPPPQDVQAITLAMLEQLGAVVTTVDGILTESYRSVVADAIAELYTDAVGESDLVESKPLPPPLVRTTAALVIVNICDEYLTPEFGDRNNNDAEEWAEMIVKKWRNTGRQIIHTRHPPGVTHRNSVLQGTTIAPEGDERVIEAQTQDAFYQTTLDDDLQSEGTDQLVFIGLPMESAVSETVRVALELGYEVIIIEDATAGYDFSIGSDFTIAGTEAHWIELTSLAALGSLVTDAKSIRMNL